MEARRLAVHPQVWRVGKGINKARQIITTYTTARDDENAGLPAFIIVRGERGLIH
jgi:hypothetical protein